MSDVRVSGIDGPEGGAGALRSLESALHAHRDAMVAGDLPAMHAAHERVRSLLSDARWREAARSGTDAAGLRAALRTTAIGGALALRGEAQAGRALSSLGRSADVYNAAGGLFRGGNSARGLSV